MATKDKSGAQATDSAGTDAGGTVPPVGLSGEGAGAVEAPAAAAEGDKAAAATGDKAAGDKTASAAAAAQGEDDKPFSMTRTAWRQQVAEREKRAQEQLAKDLGYESVDEMKTMLARATAAERKAAEQKAAQEEGGGEGEPAAAATAPSAAETPEQKAILAPLREKLRRETAAGRQMSRKARDLEAEIVRLRTDFEVKQAEGELRDACRAQGVVGDYVDDVMLRLKKKLDGMSEDEISTFNEEEWILGLKEKHPFYFGESVKPANAGHGDRETPRRPSGPDATREAGQRGGFNALTASKAEVEARIAALGIPRPRTIN